MKLLNTTSMKSPFLKAMVGWVARTQKIRLKQFSRIVFSNTPRASHTSRRPVRQPWSCTSGQPYNLEVACGPVEGSTQDPLHPNRVFDTVAHVAAVVNPSLVPPGPLGVYRQPILQTFSKESSSLIALWKSRIKPEDPQRGLRQKLDRAKQRVARWKQAQKLANTKLKIWTRRVARLEKVLARKIQAKS
jgi:hypothetical protein